MSNLLEKASILTTPTAYENGKILSVKPSVVLGEELVVNGTFQTDSDWIKSSEVTIQNNSATFTLAPSGQQVSQAISSVIGKKYKIIYEIKSITQGAFDVSIGGNLSANYNNSVGIYTEYLTATTASGFYVRSRGATNGSITNISVKEVLDADFDFTRNSSATRVNSQGLIEDMQILSGDLVSNGDFSQEGSELVTNGNFSTDSDWINGTGWTISGGAASCDGTQTSNSQLRSAFFDFSVDTTVNLSFDVINYSSGNLNVSVTGTGQADLTGINANGTYSVIVVSSAGSRQIQFTADSNFIGSIDNVSVKEVGQDWSLSADSSIFQGFANVSSTGTYQYIYQSGILTVGKKYKVEYTILNGSTGTLKLGTSLGVSSIISTVGTHSVIANALTTDFFIERLSVCDVNITNISVIEITEDTNLPRIDYTGGEGHWLFEPQRTNSIPYSEDATNWSTQSNSVLATSNQAVSPDGTLNADKLIPASGSVTSNGGRYLSFASTASTDYSVSIFVKQAEYRYVTFSYGSGAAYGFHFDLQDGVIIQELSNAQYTSISREVESLTNGWYRLKISLTDNISQAARFISVRPANELPTATNNNYATTGDGTSGIYVWGYQAEESSFATSYIPTNGSQITRLADAAFGAGSSDLINSTEGVLYAEIAALTQRPNSRRDIALSDGTKTDNVIRVHYLNGVDNTVRVQVRSGGVILVSRSITLTDIKDFHKIAISYKANEVKLYVDGVLMFTSTSPDMPTGLNQLSFSDGNGTANNFFGKTKCLAVFKEALTDAELTCLTTI